jgi:hypothetical protein
MGTIITQNCGSWLARESGGKDTNSFQTYINPTVGAGLLAKAAYQTPN